MTWEYQMLMIAIHGNSIFCIQLEKNKKTKKTWKNAWQKWYCGVLLMSTFERALWRDIEVVITRRSWKPFVRKGAWVRIPLSPLTVLRSQRDEFLVQNWISILQKARCESTNAEVPKWLKGLPWKGSRSLVAARGFKSLLLRFNLWRKTSSKKLKKFLTNRKRYDRINELPLRARNGNETVLWKLNSM